MRSSQGDDIPFSVEANISLEKGGAPSSLCHQIRQRHKRAHQPIGFLVLVATARNVARAAGTWHISGVIEKYYGCRV